MTFGLSFGLFGLLGSIVFIKCLGAVKVKHLHGKGGITGLSELEEVTVY